MGTRGAWGFVLNGEEKITYNHFDSYPTYLGITLYRWLQVMELPELKEAVERLEMVKDDDPVPDEAARRLELLGYRDSNVSEGSDWYAYLRKTQGDPRATLTAEYALDAGDFPCDSLFCEWAYVIDLDRELFEVYRGFQTEPHAEGRFSSRETVEHSTSGTYYPVKLISSSMLPRLDPILEKFEHLQDEAEAV